MLTQRLLSALRVAFGSRCSITALQRGEAPIAGMGRSDRRASFLDGNLVAGQYRDRLVLDTTLRDMLLSCSHRAPRGVIQHGMLRDLHEPQ